jgi:nitroreductase
MDAYQAILTKRDTREFTDEPIADEDLHKLLQAARMAGSAKNSQLNRLVVVTDPADRARLAEAGTYADWLARAPLAVAIVVPTEGNRPFDIGRMAQNMMVTAHALGLGSCPVTFHHQDKARAALGVPDDHEVPMGVGFGHPAPATGPKASSPRIPLDELVDWGRWQA